MTGAYSNHYDVIVAGIGAMGSATCYELARRGRRVLGIERHGIPHTHGSYHGYTRIIRLAYYEHPSYVLLLKRAFELWRHIQDVAGEQLLYVTGTIDAALEHEWVFKGAWESARLHDLPHEVLTGAELRRRFPAYHLPPDILALLQPDGGFLRPERCVVAYVKAAQALGAVIHGHEQVIEWEPLSSGVRVRTDRDVYEADKLVLSAGAWNGDLVDCLDGLIVPERQVLAWLQPTRPEYFTPEAFPVFNLLVEEGRYYGFPEFDVPGFKFGKYHHFEETGQADIVDRAPHPYDERMLRQFAEKYFPDGCGPTMNLETCLFTNTPDGHFIVDLHPTYPQVCIASPCSGHGFKFASVIGEIMAELAEIGMTRHDISLFRLDRFPVTGRRPLGRALAGVRPGLAPRLSAPAVPGQQHLPGTRGAAPGNRLGAAHSSHAAGGAAPTTNHRPGPSSTLSSLTHLPDRASQTANLNGQARRNGFRHVEDIESLW